MMPHTSTPFVDASVPDEVLTWAQATLKNAVRRNLEEPDQHLKTYGDVFIENNCFLFIISLLYY